MFVVFRLLLGFGSPAEYIRDCENGYLFDDDNLSEVLNNAINVDHITYANLSDGAFSTYAELFTVRARKVNIMNNICFEKSEEEK